MATQEEKNLRELIIALEKRVKSLEDWKRQREFQQIKKPLDEASKTIINEI